eukprot:m.486552 g.486552  ORF g.486552 m.486552 type:complete len:417 (+) comp57215_c0_seq16:1383-2633(+)
MPSQSDVLLHAMMPRFHAPHALCLIAVCPRVSGWCARKREMDTDPSQPSSSPTTEQAESVAPQYVVDFIICTPLAAFLRSVSQVATDGGQIIRLSTNSLEQQHLVQVVRDVIRLPDNVQICIRDSSLHSRRGKPELPSSGDPRPRPGVVRRFVYFICAARQNHTGPACDRYAEMGSAYCEAHDRAGRNCPYISARIQPSDFRQLLFVFPARERMLRRIDVISSTASTSKAVVTVQIMPDCYPLETYLYDIQLRVSFGYPRRDVIVGRPLIKRVWDNCQLLEVALPLELVRASWANKSVIKVIQEFMPLNGSKPDCFLRPLDDFQASTIAPTSLTSLIILPSLKRGSPSKPRLNRTLSGPSSRLTSLLVLALSHRSPSIWHLLQAFMSSPLSCPCKFNPSEKPEGQWDFSHPMLSLR